jgi:uncharacterized protein YlxW (UPF0749 family)
MTAGPAAPGARRSRNSAATILIGALLAMLGFALAVQVRSNSRSDALAGAREADLVRILDDQNSRIDRLQGQISDLQTARQRLSDSGSNNAAARQEAQRHPRTGRASGWPSPIRSTRCVPSNCWTWSRNCAAPVPR